MADGDSLVLGTANAFDLQTFLRRSASGPTTAFAVANSDGGAIRGISANDGAGVEGASNTGPGVRGSANSGVGVQGRCGSGPAVEGLSASGDGVVGITQGNAIGVLGSAYATAVGTYGTSESGVGAGGWSGAGTGVAGRSVTGTGVDGTSTSGSGVTATSTSGDAIAASSSTGAGVRGHSETADGVVGTSRTQCGVYGESQVLPAVAGRSAAHTTWTAGVMGIGANEGSGVHGTSLLGNGVQAFSRDSDALEATSVNRRGVVGIAVGTSSASVGVQGDAPSRANGSAAIGVAGTSRHGTAIFATTVDGIAGFFIGQVVVFGDLAVTGKKSAAVRHPDGSHRLTYAVESPDSWLEDVGRGQLVDGHGTVTLDPDFAAVIDADDYHAFLTPEGNSNGLYVGARTSEGFEVHEQHDGTASLSFSYRVVGRRGDIEAARLSPVDLPAVPDLPDVTIPERAEPPPRPRTVAAPVPPDLPTPQPRPPRGSRGPTVA